MKKIDEILATNVKARRNALRYTQDFLASEAGTDISTIQRIEAGTRWPSAETASAIADALKVPVSTLYQPQVPQAVKPTPAEALLVLQDLVRTQSRPVAVPSLPERVAKLLTEVDPEVSKHLLAAFENGLLNAPKKPGSKSEAG